jgi:hypothetical protein
MLVNENIWNLFKRILPRYIWILSVSFSVVCSLYAQETDKKVENDSMIKRPVNQSPLHGFQTSIILSCSLGGSSDYVPVSLHQALTNLPASLSLKFQQQIDVALPWKQELAKQNDLLTLRTILGAVQAGGTAYILYEHVRKYGLK